MSADEPSFIDQKVVIVNRSGNLTKLILEPWTDEVEINKGDAITAVGHGPDGERAYLEIEYEKNIVVIYGWQGSVVRIYVNGKSFPTLSSEYLAPSDTCGFTKINQ
jgi:hypothetical protein